VPALWLAAAVAVAVGPTDEHETSKRAMRAGEASAADALLAAARYQAESEGLSGAMAEAADSIGFRPHDITERG
jgi:hypothetical protein